MSLDFASKKIEAQRVLPPSPKRLVYGVFVVSRLEEALGSLGSRLDKVLVNCCGAGFEVGFLLDKRLDVTGLDISRVMLGECKKKFRECRLVLGDAEELPFRDGCFDLALVVMGLHHLPNPYKGIEELSRVSNLFVVIIDLIEPLTTRILERFPFFKKEWCGTEPNRLSVVRATSTLQLKGFCIKIAVTYFSHFPALLKPVLTDKMSRILFHLQQRILKRFCCLVPILCNELIVVAARA